MHIAQVATLSAPVRQHSQGSVEALIWLMTRELHRMGHEVTVFASGDSQLPAGQLVSVLPGPYGALGSLDDWYLCEWLNLCRAIEQSRRFDVIHTHAYLWGIPLESFSAAPMVHTLHIVPDANIARLWSERPEARVTAISRHQWSGWAQLHPTAIIPHGVDVSEFRLSSQPGDYLAWLGRFVSGKGPLLAIETARKLGIRLLMAGPPNPYFREKIQPLVDKRSVEYVGYLSGPKRSEFLGGAKALVYPIQYPEAFGLVLLEAMLCGTPVAAMKLGAVPEIIDEGITGFTAETHDEFPAAVTRCLGLDRQRIRALAETRFSVERMVNDYLKLYETVRR
jgi:glycosyltransferase involved in cell wall biosynthesis